MLFAYFHSQKSRATIHFGNPAVSKLYDYFANAVLVATQSKNLPT
jgi:hypothetical protein